MADLSKVKIGSDYYNLKDSKAREDLATEIAKLKTAAYRDVAAAISDVDGKIADAATVKAYVDAQVGQIHKFDIIVCEALAAKIPAGAIYKTGSTTITGTMPATADTMYKIYLVLNDTAGAGNYVEWLTVRSGTEGSYTYAWEAIGNTSADLANYVKKVTQIAGIQIGEGISVADLQTALGLKELAYKDKADVVAQYNGQTITGVKADYTPSGTVALNAFTQTSTAASLTKGDYTPAGEVSGSVVAAGSINVTLADAASATEAELSTVTYTPAGTIAAAASEGSFQALKTASFGEDAEGVQITGTINKPDIDLTSSAKTFATGLTGGKVASFTEGAFTPASIGSGFFNAGSAASYSHDGFSGGSLGEASKGTFAAEGMVAVVGSGSDSECLIISNAATAQAVTAQGSFTAAVYGSDHFTANTLPSIDVTKFNGGSKAADTWVANELQSAATASINEVSAAALHAAPVFSGNKYKVSTTNDTALKNVVFTATNSAAIVNKVEYKKQVVDAHTFTGTSANISASFSGSKAANILVTGVNYDKATANGASFTGSAAQASVGSIAVSAADLIIKDAE